MNALCAKCGTHLAEPWSFCPHCGAALEHAAAKPREHAPAPTRGAFGGAMTGVILAPILIIVGVMLCLTALGALAGVPLIAAGILAPLAGPLFGMGEHKAKCPSCGGRVVTTGDGKPHTCPLCNHAFTVNGHEAVSAG